MIFRSSGSASASGSVSTARGIMSRTTPTQAVVSDTPPEKRAIGAPWESKRGGKGVFVLVEKSVDGKETRSQILGRLHM